MQKEHSRLSSGAEGSNLVLHRAALIAIGAVVVARQDVPVHIAQADPVVAVLLARRNAGLIALDTGIDNVLSSTVGSKRGGREAKNSGDESSGTHVDGLSE